MNLAKFFKDEVKRMAELFEVKQKQYSQVDELNNFKLGALLLDGKIDLDSQLESAKAYMAKHIAFLYSAKQGNIKDDKIFESLGDIIVYCHIMRYMISKYNIEKADSETTDIKNDKVKTYYDKDALDALKKEYIVTDPDFGKEKNPFPKIYSKRTGKRLGMMDPLEMCKEEAECYNNTGD